MRHQILQKLAFVFTPRYPDTSPGVPDNTKNAFLAEKDAIEREFPSKKGIVGSAYLKMKNKKRLDALKDDVVMPDAISPASRAVMSNASVHERPRTAS
jgi:hypothetical protein